MHFELLTIAVVSYLYLIYKDRAWQKAKHQNGTGYMMELWCMVIASGLYIGELISKGSRVLMTEVESMITTETGMQIANIPEQVRSVSLLLWVFMIISTILLIQKRKQEIIERAEAIKVEKSDVYIFYLLVKAYKASEEKCKIRKLSYTKPKPEPEDEEKEKETDGF